MKTIHSPGVVPTFEIGFNGPTSDITNLDTWRGIPGAVGFPNRFTFINEATPDDSNYISQGLGNGGSIYECGCSGPVLGAGSIILSFRVRRMGGTGSLTAHLSLDRGGNPIHDLQVAAMDVNMPLSFTTFTYSLTPAEVTSVYGFGGEMQMFLSCSGGPGTDALECSWLHIDYFP